MKYLGFFMMLACFSACHTAPLKLKKMQGDFSETGIITVSMDTPLPLYAGPDDTMPFDEITFSRVLFGKEKGSIAIKTKYIKDRLKPYQMGGGSSDEEGKQLINSGLGPWSACLTFRVISSTPQYFEVLVNDVTKEIAYLEKEGRTVFSSQEEYHSRINEQQRKFPSGYFLYETWTNYLMRCEYISIENYEVYNATDGKVLEKIVAGDTYIVIDVNGDWAKVLRKDGPVWIQWRKNNNLTMVPIEYTVE
jgi:hypothetical protein